MNTRGAGFHDFRSKLFLSHSTKTFCIGTLPCLRTFWEPLNFMHKRGILGVSAGNSSSHIVEKIS